MLYAQTFKPIKQIFYFIETMRGINRQPKKVIRVSQIEFVESESDDEDVEWPEELASAAREAEAFVTQAKKQRSEVEQDTRRSEGQR